MKKLISLALVIFSLCAEAQSIFQPIAPMPNGSGGFHNSPNNFQNSPNNSSAQNGIFDANGNRSGYTTPTPSGGVNIWDNNGNRLGYVPGR